MLIQDAWGRSRVGSYDIGVGSKTKGCGVKDRKTAAACPVRSIRSAAVTIFIYRRLDSNTTLGV